jgi:exopolysaccharide biosynthesis WecB/TagA/CpsF family protein
MVDLGKKNILGVQVSAIDYDGALAAIVAAAQARRPLSVSALAVHGVMTGALDPVQRYRLNHIDIVAPDGQPVRWALNLLHRAGLADRVYGPTLTLKLCARAAELGLPVYFYGSRPEVLAALVARLRGRYPQLIVAGAEPSRFRHISDDEQRAIAAQIRASGAAIVFVGLGCPRQEVWAYENRELLGMPVIAVGAAFDFHAGLLPQAPPRLQRSGLEWAFRLAQEPQRLWRRYLLLNPLYVGMLLLQASGLRRFELSSAQEPAQQLRYG